MTENLNQRRFVLSREVVCSRILNIWSESFARWARAARE